ncbi:MAG: MarR family transcriptional regulator [Lachnospiraceae bacterium]|nr:MarR family transcriptional regulator [Lachnospiraceae bacterium]
MEEGTCRFHMGHRIRKLDNMLKRNMQLALSGLGVDEVTAMNGFIIQYLYHHADQTVYQRDIEKEFKIGRSAVTNILTRMEENGFIHRETDGSDARLKRLTLTAKGEEQCQLLQDAIEWLNCRQLQGISQEEQERFFATLEKIEGNAGRLAARILGGDDSWTGEIHRK